MEQKVTIRKEEQKDWAVVEDHETSLLQSLCAWVCRTLFGPYHAGT